MDPTPTGTTPPDTPAAAPTPPPAAATPPAAPPIRPVMPDRTPERPDGSLSATNDDFVATSTSETPEQVAAALGLPPAESTPAAGEKPAAEAAAAPTTPEAEAEAARKASEAGKALSERGRSLQQRLDQATYEKGETERKLQEQIRSNAELEAQQAERAKTPPPPAVPPVKPVFDSFADQPDPHAAFTAAVGEWAAKYAAFEIGQQQTATREKADAESHQRANTQALDDIRAAQYSVYEARRDVYWETAPTAKADIEKWAETQKALPPEQVIRVPPVMESMILESEFGPELMHRLTQNPTEFERITKLPTNSRVALAVGELLAEVKAARTRPAPPAPPDPAAALARTARAPGGSPADSASRTPTPPPMAPPSGASAASTTDDLESLPQDEYNRRMNAKEGRPTLVIR